MSNKIYPKLLLVGEQNIGKTSFITNKNIFFLFAFSYAYNKTKILTYLL